MMEDARYLHLVPTESWDRQKVGPAFVPEAYDSDGFIHLTIGGPQLLEVANLFYKHDAREYCVLEIEKDRIDAPVQFDDDSGRFPHVYGPLNVDAVVAVHPVQREADGTFIGIAYT